MRSRREGEASGGGRRAALLGAGLACAAVAGCASFWDDVTSRDFKFSQLYTKPNPFVVLQDSTDGDQRAKALRALSEPKQHGGTDQDQEAVVKILTTAASTEKQFLPRLAAIQALGHFQDPRAVPGLTNAFYNAGSFTPELAVRVQCEALAALGETGNPEAAPFIAKVLRGAASGNSEQEQQQALDLRIAAARALGHFKDHQAVEALVEVLRHDRDVALCDCAYVSLQADVDRDLPPDFHDWDTLLAETRKRPADAAADRPLILAWFAEINPFAK